MIRLASSVVVHRAPFGGGFVVDPVRLAAVEVDEPTIDVLTRGQEVCDEDEVPKSLRELVTAGLRDGWLTTDRQPGQKTEEIP